MKLATVLLYWFGLLNWTDAQRSDITPRSLDGDQNHCKIFETCSECLQKAGCAWCLQEDFTNDGEPLSRCNPTDWFEAENDHFVSCSKFETFDTPETKIVQDAEFDLQNVVNQLRPQKISVKTGPHMPVNFQVEFKRVEGYPVDLYYLMDLSHSMKPSKDKLVNLAASLKEAMGKITNDFQLGFGSFIDKPISPFTNEVEKSKPYLFQHHMKLSKDTNNEFTSDVSNAETYDNMDSPEGGLEALMQIAVCTKEIGWRNNSHRLVIFSTDGPYHIAGDGKLAGIISPNDEICHISADRKGSFLYDHFEKLDYPSIAQISRQLAENSINVIFAVPQSVVSIYRDLSTRISGSNVGELTNDSSNIVALIQEQYNKISSTVRPSHKAPNGVRVSYTTSCLNDGKFSPVDRCEGIQKDSSVKFNVTISVEECRKKNDFKDLVEFSPIGVQEVVRIELDVTCRCPCEQEATKKTTAEKVCRGVGKYRCGNCECNPGFWGPSCECEVGPQTLNPDDKGCKPPGISNSSSINCSGRGRCFCGATCLCRSPPDRKVWGDFCQCDDFACPVSPNNKQVCSGPLQGTCPCNSDTCVCKNGWEGESCDCPVDKATCYPSGLTTEKPCSGRGTCKCGECVCNGDSYGKYCETLPCEELKDCVQCKAFQSGPFTEEQCNECPFKTELFDEISVNNQSEMICSFLDKDNCNFFFIRNQLKLESVIRVLKTKECSQPPNILAIAAGVAGAILAIGLLLLLLWKILTTIHDRLEYAKFLRDRDQAKWDRGDNPIYKRATTLFANPAYTPEN